MLLVLQLLVGQAVAEEGGVLPRAQARGAGEVHGGSEGLQGVLVSAAVLHGWRWWTTAQVFFCFFSFLRQWQDQSSHESTFVICKKWKR